MRRCSAGRVHDSLRYLRSTCCTEIKTLFHPEGGIPYSVVIKTARDAILLGRIDQ